MLEREKIFEIVVAIGAVAVMLAAMIVIGQRYSTANSGTLTAAGGEMLVGAIFGFIMLLTAVGVTLAYKMNPSEESGDNETNAA
jgi:hypothetical protein